MKREALRCSLAAFALVAFLASARPPAFAETPAAANRPDEAASPGPPAGAEIQSEPAPPAPLEPLFIRPLTEIQTGRNDSNPVWSPSGMFIAFERSVGEKKDIRIALADGTVFQTVYHLNSPGGGREMNFTFPGIVEETSYNAGIAWAPGEGRFAFMSNGGEGNYDLFLADLGGGDAIQLTSHKEKDGQAQWSPSGNGIVFTSGRTGKGDIFVIDADTQALTRLTRDKRQYLYPQWSPDGKRIAMTGGSNENHDIFVITDVARPFESLKALTTWEYDDIRPIWSPDGTKIAFYSNYNLEGDPKAWCIIVIAGDGSDPASGEGLAAKIVATEVIPDTERGPAWLPDSRRIVYVKNDRAEYNPLYVVDLKTGVSTPVRTETKMNHDASVSHDGVIAFRAQVNQWDQIYLMKLKD